MIRFWHALVLSLVALTAAPLHAQTPEPASIEAIDTVWAGHSVPFAITTSKTQLYVAYYDAARQLTLAQRPLNNPAHWVYHKLDTWVGWDSHNQIALGLDDAGALHVAANMHVDPLTLFQSAPDGDVRTLKRVTTMVDPARETAVTYPVFLTDASQRLILKYRDGTSGRGNEIYNIFNANTQTWQALTQNPLVDGEGQRNAYFVGPVRGRDGFFHLTWVWRDTPQADTNHDLSYAKSADLIHWQTASGKPLTLPIRLKDAEIVDPVPVKGGMINNNTVLGFDAQNRPMITYHKYDTKGQTQIYVARFEGKSWRIAQISRWTNFRWEFGGGGTLIFPLTVEGAQVRGGALIVPVVREGQRLEFRLDPKTLETLAEIPVTSMEARLRPHLKAPADHQVNLAQTTGSDGRTYVLAWAALPPHRDRPRTEIPLPNDLKLFIFEP